MPFRRPRHAGPVDAMPALPDHWDVIEEADAEHPFRLATSPARGFLNSTFNETPIVARARSGRPEVMIHPRRCRRARDRGRRQGRLGNRRGDGAAARAAVRRRAPRRADRRIASGRTTPTPDGRGINTLTGADAIAPYRRRRVPRQQGLAAQSGGLIAHCHFAASRRRSGGVAQRSAAASSAALASTHAVPSAVSTRFQNGARVFR